MTETQNDARSALPLLLRFIVGLLAHGMVSTYAIVSLYLGSG